MTHEDESVGYLLSRREVITLLGATGALWMMGGNLTLRRSVAAMPAPACVVRPEQTEGPYFVDERLNRSDIRSDPTDGRVRPGTPLALTLRDLAPRRRRLSAACRAPKWTSGTAMRWASTRT